jgi:hypothetical protein
MRGTFFLFVGHAFAESVQPQDCAAKLSCVLKKLPVIGKRYAQARSRKIILKTCGEGRICRDCGDISEKVFCLYGVAVPL